MKRHAAKWFSVFCVFALLKVFTTHAQDELEPPPQISLLQLAATYQTLYGDPLQGLELSLADTLNEGNCGASGFGWGGQAWAVSGAVGGLTLTDPGGAMTAFDYAANAGFGTDGGNAVSLLVVDDFAWNGGGAIADFQNRVITEFMGGVLTDAEASTELATLPHGMYVFQQTAELLAGIGATSVELMPVVSNGYHTEDIALGIRNAIGSQIQNGSSRFVVNMSFAVIPCGVWEDFRASGYVNFEDYVNALKTNDPNLQGALDELQAELRDILMMPLDPFNDMLLRQIQTFCEPLETGSEYEATIQNLCSVDGLTIVYVAAAGNFGVSYSFYPGAWDEVTSVGALDLASGSVASYSNLGEVMQPGGWYEAGGVFYAGTSFAAPVESVIQAINLTQ